MVKDGHHHRKAPYRKCPNWSKTCFDLCDPDLWPLTLTFGMDITFVNGYYFWNFHDDTMRSTFEKGDRQTDGQTDEKTIHEATWSQLKNNIKRIKLGKYNYWLTINIAVQSNMLKLLWINPKIRQINHIFNLFCCGIFFTQKSFFSSCLTH